jgi:hypothetical protein
VKKTWNFTYYAVTHPLSPVGSEQDAGTARGGGDLTAITGVMLNVIRSRLNSNPNGITTFTITFRPEQGKRRKH